MPLQSVGLSLKGIAGRRQGSHAERPGEWGPDQNVVRQQIVYKGQVRAAKRSAFQWRL